MIYKNKKLLFLLITIFLLGFQSVSLAHHDDDEIHRNSTTINKTLSTLWSNGYLGQILTGNYVTEGHLGWEEPYQDEYGAWINDSRYVDENDVLKLFVQRGESVQVDLEIPVYKETGLADTQYEFELELYDHVGEKIEHDDWNKEAVRFNWTEPQYGVVAEDSAKLVKRLIFTANATGNYYVNVNGFGQFDLYDPIFEPGGTRHQGIPYKIKATKTGPTAINSYSTKATLSEYPAWRYNQPNSADVKDYYYYINIKKGDTLALTLKNPSTGKMDAKLYIHGSQTSTSNLVPSFIVKPGEQKKITFTPSITKIYIRVEGLMDFDFEGKTTFTLNTNIIRKSTISITSPSTLRYPGSGKIYGRITRDGKTYPSGAAVKLYHKPYGKSWSLLKTVSTNQYGNYTFTGIKPDRLTQYYVSWAGDPSSADFIRYAGAKSATKVTKVYPSLNIAASRTSLYLGNVTTISGKLGPTAGHKGKIIYIQMYNTATRKWSGIGSAKLSSTGVYNFTWKPTLKGRHKLRAYFGGDADHLAKSSSYKYISAL